MEYACKMELLNEIFKIYFSHGIFTVSNRIVCHSTNNNYSRAPSFLSLNVFKCPFLSLFSRVRSWVESLEGMIENDIPLLLFSMCFEGKTVGWRDRLWQRGADGADK